MWKLDRLGRDLRHVVNVVHGLTDRDVGLKGLLRLTPLPLLANWFAALAEFARELSSERTKASVASVRARGRKGWAALQNDPRQSPSGVTR